MIDGHRIGEKGIAVLYGGGIVGLLLLALWLYCIFDVISTQESLVRNLPKVLWLVLVIILPAVGSIAWLILGRPPGAGFGPGDTGYRRPSGFNRPSRAIGPEDSPEFIAEIEDRASRLRRWEEDLKRREDELRRREGDDPPP